MYIFLQLSLVVANIAGTDFPSEWPSLSQQLLAVALSPLTDPGSIAASVRAAKTLKLVLQSLQRTSSKAKVQLPAE